MNLVDNPTRHYSMAYIERDMEKRREESEKVRERERGRERGRYGDKEEER